MSEIPVHFRPRRLSDWINPTDARKVHSLIDKVYKRKNLEMAWEKVKENRGSGGVDGQTLEAFVAQLSSQLDRLHRELKEDLYEPLPVRQHPIPKRDKPGEYRMLGIPAIYDRVCQQALLNRLEPIFEPIFDDASFGYRRGRSAKDALRKVWQEIQAGAEWIVDADLRDFFGSADHEKLLTLVAQRVADSRVVRLIRAMLKAGSYGRGRFYPTERGTPQGSGISPLLSNLFLHYTFDRWMARNYPNIGFERFAADALCHGATEAQAKSLKKALEKRFADCGLQLHPEKAKVVYCKEDDRWGNSKNESFAFLGYSFRARRSKNRFGKFFVNFSPGVSNAATKAIREEIRRWQLRCRIDRWIDDLARMFNPVIRGWITYYGRYYKSALYPPFRYLDRCLAHWAMAKYKRLRRHRQRAEHWVSKTASRDPQLFAHWPLLRRAAAGR